MKDHSQLFTGKAHRIFMGALGLLLLGTGIYALFFSHAQPLLRFGASVVFIALGANAIYAAWLAKQSWISRIGPLP